MADEPTSDFSTVIITNSILFFSDHLYLSYFVLFSPHLLKVASFLSPLLFVTFVVFIVSVIAHGKDYQEVEDDDLGVYLDDLFGTCLMNCLNEDNPLGISEEQVSDLDFGAKEKNPGPVSEFKNIVLPGIDGRRMENLLKILDQFERMSLEKKTTISDDKALPDEGGIKVKKADGDDGVQKDPRKLQPMNSMGKEWKRTLACKLFEERHNVEGGDGMDSLWEAYEAEPVVKLKQMSRPIKKMSETQFSVEGYENDQEDEDGQGNKVDGGRLCCLNVMKFSTGMMNPGFRKPNLVKISKAISGYGWLHHVRKHSKKVHNNNGDR